MANANALNFGPPIYYLCIYYVITSPFRENMPHFLI